MRFLRGLIRTGDTYSTTQTSQRHEESSNLGVVRESQDLYGEEIKRNRFSLWRAGGNVGSDCAVNRNKRAYRDLRVVGRVNFGTLSDDLLRCQSTAVGCVHLEMSNGIEHRDLDVCQ